MKGKQLTLQEVLDLEDGTKVWVEETEEEFEDWSQVYTINKKEERLYTKDGQFYKFNSYSFGDKTIEVYEWIEEPEMPYPNNMQQTIKDMATEICNLRSMDLTDENIRLIVEEFS